MHRGIAYRAIGLSKHRNAGKQSYRPMRSIKSARPLRTGRDIGGSRVGQVCILARSKCVRVRVSISVVTRFRVRLRISLEGLW